MTKALCIFGWDDDWASTFDRLALPPGAQPARITEQHRDRWVIETAAGPRSARMVGSDPERTLPVTGDWVAAQEGSERTDPWEIVAVLPRRSSVRRGAAGRSEAVQALATNVDRLWIVQALDTPPNLRSLERYLAVAWESGASPELVLTKADLAPDLDAAVASVAEISFGVPVWVVSIADAAALESLERSLVRGQTVALLGPSGAGKSTLINRLAHAEVSATGAVRARDRKGRHTTTDRQLFSLPNGALLLDTPGLRELKVLDLSEGLGLTFPDIYGLAADCRFRDCSHASEPGCAVLAAVEGGHLGPDRLESYRKLQAEAEFERRKRDPLAQAAHVADHKTAMKTLRYHPKYRGPD